MFGWLFGKRDKQLEDQTKSGFEAVKKDIDKIGNWIKHLHGSDKQLFENVNELKVALSSIKEEIGALKEGIALAEIGTKNKQVFKKTGVWEKQTGVLGVGNGVQTAVQTGNFYEILHNLSSNERLLVFTLMNAGEDMKLSYEDLARLLGKERSTIRGQINAIKRKSEGLLFELTEPNGKKRVYVAEEVRNKLLKYAKVRVVGRKKKKVRKEKEEKVIENES